MRKRIVGLLLPLFMILTLAFPAQAAGNVERVKQSVARVYVENTVRIGEDVYQFTATGSAFAVGKANQNPRDFVTNNHVVAPLTSVPTSAGEEVPCIPLQQAFYLIFDNVANKVPANVLYRAEKPDLAILRLPDVTDKRIPIALHTFETLEAGLSVTAVGLPSASDVFLTSQAQDMLYSRAQDMTVNRGIISRVLDGSTTSEGELIQTDTSINSGNSGGPLVDEQGNVLGVNTVSVIMDDNRLVQGMNFAVSANEVAKMLDAQRVPYMRAGDGVSVWIMVLLAVVGLSVVALIALLAVRLNKTKAGKARPNVQGGNPARTVVGAEGALAGRAYTLEQSLVIGRDPRRCQIVFPEGTAGVSGVHCTVRFDGVRVLVTDHGSSFGTFIGQNKLRKDTPTVWHRGQTLQIGSTGQRLTLQS